MAKRSRRNDEHQDSRRGVDQVILTVALWFIPISLFGYVGFKILEASGQDPYALLPVVPIWEVMLGAVALLGLVVFVVTFKARENARHHADDAMDRYAVTHDMK